MVTDSSEQMDEIKGKDIKYCSTNSARSNFEHLYSIGGWMLTLKPARIYLFPIKVHQNMYGSRWEGGWYGTTVGNI